MASHDDIVDTLNDLIETSKDGQLGFTTCAKHATAANLQTLFLQRANECESAAAELAPFVQQYGGEPEDSGTTSGALHRGWTAVRGSITGYSDQAILDECERGEDAALARYRKALKEEELPAEIRVVVERQLAGVQRNHDQIKTLRDSLRATSA